MVSMGHIWRQIDDALDTGMRHARDGISGRLRLQKVKIQNDRARIDGTDNDLAARTTGAVRELDVDSFSELRRRAVSGDRMQHDHIPSFAALKRALELERGVELDADEERILYQSAACVELRNELHFLSRTYGGRNTAEQIELDAQDLRAAAERDYATLRENLTNTNDYTPVEIDEVIGRLRALNERLGI